MKISYNHLIYNINPKPAIDELSQKLFQLGHEHEVEGEIFDFEFTPNRGDCLSVNGILRDLAVFYEIDLNHEIYLDNIKPLNLDFINNSPDSCPQISFLKIEIDDEISEYNHILESYFSDLGINKNNFFTDISNYVAYETGQPTHCYDSTLLKSSLTLENIEGKFSFETLLGNKINLSGKNLVFLKQDEIINLAGVIGGKSTSCSKGTKSVIIECAYFNPEEIIGQSIKYDITSDAAHKFERSVDPKCQDTVLRRFIKIVSEHANINNLEIFTQSFKDFKHTYIPFDVCEVNRIIGTEISQKQYEEFLLKLGFSISDNIIKVPSYRSDIKTQNDLAEETARIIGYDNIPINQIKIINQSKKIKPNKENKIKKLLIDNGFYEVINNPFESSEGSESIEIDNPLDSNKKFLRTSLKNSLVKNLLYNERRQHDSIKLFEISDIYSLSKTSDAIESKRVIGIISSGRVGKNYIDFSVKMDDSYLLSLITNYLSKDKIKFINISRDNLHTKSKNIISYIEFNIDDIHSNIAEYINLTKDNKIFNKYVPVSDYPSSNRDISISISDSSSLKEIENNILSFSNKILKDSFIFDFYQNKKNDEIKLGFRFVFQSNKETLTDLEIDKVMSDIIDIIRRTKSIKIPGLDH